MRSEMVHARPGRKLPALLLGLSCAALISAFIVMSPALLLYILGMVLCIFVAIISIRKPELSIVGFAVITSTIIYVDVPVIHFGPGSFQLTDILLIFLAFSYIWSSITRACDPTFMSHPNRVLIYFLIWSSLSALLSLLFFNAEFNNVMRIFRFVSYFSLSLFTAKLVRTRAQQLFSATFLLISATLVSICMIVQAFIGVSVSILPGRVEQAAVLDKSLNAMRILPPGEILLYFSFISLVTLIALVRYTYVRLALIVVCMLLIGIGILLTFNRNHWVAIILLLFLVTVLLPGPERIRFVRLAIAAGLVLALLITVGTVAETHLSGFAGAVAARFGSLLSSKTLAQDGSIEWRGIENAYALQSINRHPLTGIGLGTSYRPELYTNDTLTYYVHNSYIWITLDLGLPGLILFLFFYLWTISRGLWHWRQIEDRVCRAVVLGLSLGCLGTLAMAVVSPILMQPYSIVPIAIATGLIDAIIAGQPHPARPATPTRIFHYGTTRWTPI